MIRLSKRLLLVLTCLMLGACGQSSTQSGTANLNRCGDVAAQLDAISASAGIVSPFPSTLYDPECMSDSVEAAGLSYTPYTPRTYEVTYTPNPFGPLTLPASTSNNSSSSSSGGSNSSSGGTRSNTTRLSGDPYENYVDKYPDLLAAFNSGAGGGQSKSAWGKAHFCGSGRIEGRSYSGLSSASCGASLCRGGGESTSNSRISSSSSSPSSSSGSSPSSASSSAASCSAPSVSPSSSTASSSTDSSSTPRLSSSNQGGR